MEAVLSVTVRPPAPVIPCEIVVWNPSVSIVPPPAKPPFAAFSVMAREDARLKLSVSFNVPPLKISGPVAAPSAESAPVATVPWSKYVPPE